jgi:hypothetical protein
VQGPEFKPLQYCRKKNEQTKIPGQALVAHTCNPSYSGGRDQEDRSLKPARENNFQDPISKKPITDKGLMEWLKVEALSSNPSTAKHKNKNHKTQRTTTIKKNKRRCRVPITSC